MIIQSELTYTKLQLNLEKSCLDFQGCTSPKFHVSNLKKQISRFRLLKFSKWVKGARRNWSKNCGPTKLPFSPQSSPQEFFTNQYLSAPFLRVTKSGRKASEKHIFFRKERVDEKQETWKYLEDVFLAT